MLFRSGRRGEEAVRAPAGLMEVDERGIPVWQFGQMGNNGNGLNQLFHPEHAQRLENGNTAFTARRIAHEPQGCAPFGHERIAIR